ncbi:MAG: tetratricopeptide repeat protein, partial [Candidatus Omnitrophota bacterium]|nr:tetratricopeptide repeat protein [Candidatus Omnitrophota bacterium]
MTEEDKKQLISIAERSAIVLLIIALAVIIGWSSRQIKERRAAYQEKSPVASETSGKNEDSAESYFDEGVRLAKMSRFEEAISALNKAIEINPAHYRAISNLGLVYKNMFLADKDPESMNKAIELYQRAISINPNFADVYNNLGDAYFNQSKYAEAEKEFKECVRLDPLNVNACNNLGVALIMQDK